ncbi:S24 family peptidase, partial [Melissococcus plutonius]
MKLEDSLKNLINSKFGNLKYFSQKIDLPYTTVRSILQRGIMNAKVENVIKIAEGLGMKAEDLIKINDTKSITTIYNELNQTRQKNVYNYAEQQLNEQKAMHQSNIIPFNCNDDQLASFDWYGYVSAGTGEFLDGNERKTTIQLPKKNIPKNADFTVTVNGDSMKPVFKNHEMIFVEKTTDLSSGSIGIVVVENEAFVKKIYIYDDCITLVSLNPTYKDK